VAWLSQASRAADVTIVHFVNNCFLTVHLRRMFPMTSTLFHFVTIVHWIGQKKRSMWTPRGTRVSPFVLVEWRSSMLFQCGCQETRYSHNTGYGVKATNSRQNIDSPLRLQEPIKQLHKYGSTVGVNKNNSARLPQRIRPKCILVFKTHFKANCECGWHWKPQCASIALEEITKLMFR
jgi:hypothetical protein